MHLFLIAFLVVPFGFVLSTGALHGGHRLAFFLTALVAIASQLHCRWIRYFFYYAMGLIALSFFGATFGFLPEKVARDSIEAHSFLLVGAVIYHAAQNNKIKMKIAYRYICAGVLIQISIAVFQWYDLDINNLVNLFINVERDLSSKITGTLGNNNFLAAWCVISIPFFFRKYWFCLLPLHGFILYRANTSGAIVALAIGLIYYGFRSTKKEDVKLMITFAVGLCGAAYIYMTQIDTSSFQGENSALADRFGMWELAWKSLSSNTLNLLFGTGPGSAFNQGYALHNDWLELARQYGLIGFVLVFIHVLRIPRDNVILSTALVIACVNALVNPLIVLAPSAFFVLLIGGLMWGEKCYSQKYTVK